MRAVNRVAGSLLGLVLAVFGLSLAVEVVRVAYGRRLWPAPLHRWWERLSTTTVGDRAVLGVAVAVGLIGLAVLVVQLWPWRPERVRTEPPDDAWWLSRRSVERRVAQAAGSVPGTRHPKVAVRGRPRRWRLSLRVDAAADQHDALTAAVRRELDRLNAPVDTPVTLAVRTQGRVA